MIPLSVEEVRALGLGELDGLGRADRAPDRLAPRSAGRPLRRRFAAGARSSRTLARRARRRSSRTTSSRRWRRSARLLRDRSGARFVGITGSTGKTSTKDILAALCAPVARTVATEGSYNAELGVPLTLGRLEPDTEICLVEMGMRGFGQIAELCEIVRPDVGVITAVGPVHLELVGSVDGVARSKAELVAALPAGGIAVVPVVGRARAAPPRTTSSCAASARSTSSCATDGAHVAFGGGRIRFPFTSRHQAQNALTALTAYEALGLPLDRLAESAAAVRLSPLARRGAAARRAAAS